MNINNIYGNFNINKPAVNVTENSYSLKNVDKAMSSQKTEKCQSCSNRKYQDSSDDEGVSFQAPTKISPEESGSKVLAHEMEHYNREQVKASQENREIVSQSIRLKYAVCSECGKQYVSGGVTETTSRIRQKKEKEGFEAQYNESTVGKYLPKLIDQKI